MPTFQRVATSFSYSSAVFAGDTAYLGLHRGFGDSFASQLRGAFDGVTGTLAKLGLTPANLVKVTVWLKNIKDLPAMEQFFCEFLPDGQFPARMTATTEFSTRATW